MPTSQNVAYADRMTALTANPMPTVILVAGHGGKDPGAVLSGKTEHEVITQLGWYVIGGLTSSDIVHTPQVIVAPEGDEEDLQATIEWVNDVCKELKARKQPHFLVDIHLNSAPAGVHGRGAEAFVWPTNTTAKRIVDVIRKEYVAPSYTPNVNPWRGTKDGSHLGIIKRTSCTAILFECGFIGDPEFMNVPFWYWGGRLGQGIYQACLMLSKEGGPAL